MLQSARHLKAVALIAALGSASIVAACGDDDDPTDPEEEEFAVIMSGSAERPNPVTTTATGSAELEFTGSGSISFSINVNGLSGPATMAHIHGPATTSAAAGILVTFTNLSTSPSGQLATGTITATDNPGTVSLDSLKTLFRNGNAYINVHTAANPGGEVRGQINSN
jgi:hypothetical protein